MKKESISYEIMIDIISNIVKKYIENEAITVKEGETK
jgi:hypothetical protein